MRCNWRLPEVSPVIAGFNYDVHNVSSCLQIQHFTTAFGIWRLRFPTQYGYFGDWVRFGVGLGFGVKISL